MSEFDMFGRLKLSLKKTDTHYGSIIDDDLCDESPAMGKAKCLMFFLHITSY